MIFSFKSYTALLSYTEKKKKTGIVFLLEGADMVIDSLLLSLGKIEIYDDKKKKWTDFLIKKREEKENTTNHLSTR